MNGLRESKRQKQRRTDRPRIPAASVILPVFNGEQYLEQAIESVLNQSFGDFELILLNDGSTDHSLEKLEHYARMDARCRVYSWSNRGLVWTLNEGTRIARADIIIRMDADDICRPTRFEKQLRYLKLHPECVVVGARIMLIDTDGDPIRTFSDEIDHDEIDAANLSGKCAITHPTAVLRKASLVSVGGYRSDFAHAEDLDLFLRLAEIGRLAKVDEVLLDYRQHLNSIGYRYELRQQEAMQRAVTEARRRRGVNEALLPLLDTRGQAKSISKVHQMWAWWALASGNCSTARKHALKAFKCDPFDIGNLRLLACVVRGY